MSTENTSKINRLLSLVSMGVVLQASWLSEHGYDLNLQKRYRQSKWLESVGHGAMMRARDNVGYEGAVYALQQQSAMTVHPAGRTALSLLGLSHYLELDEKRVTLFGGKDENLPAWFRERDWGVTIDYHKTSFLPQSEGLTDIKVNALTLKVSTAARAIMECLYLAPQKQDLVECYEAMEGLNSLHPAQVQSLLEKCGSVKVKRLFLYMAEKAGHEWFHRLDVKKIDTGSGKRSLVKEGVYVQKYQMTVPKELENDDGPKI